MPRAALPTESTWKWKIKGSPVLPPQYFSTTVTDEDKALGEVPRRKAVEKSYTEREILKRKLMMNLRFFIIIIPGARKIPQTYFHG